MSKAARWTVGPPLAICGTFWPKLSRIPPKFLHVILRNMFVSFSYFMFMITGSPSQNVVWKMFVRDPALAPRKLCILFPQEKLTLFWQYVRCRPPHASCYVSAVCGFGCQCHCVLTFVASHPWSQIAVIGAPVTWDDDAMAAMAWGQAPPGCTHAVRWVFNVFGSCCGKWQRLRNSMYQ